jgi:hypothetical protein
MAIYELLESTGPRRRYQLRSPVDRSPIGELECMTSSDGALAVERARKAQPASTIYKAVGSLATAVSRSSAPDATLTR